MSKLIRAVLSDEKGATSIEYGLICALIAVVSIAAVGTLGQKAESVYTQVNMAMSGSGSGVGGAGAGGRGLGVITLLLRSTLRSESASCR
jgi:pilus assembly protein Flp/PilA